MSVVVDGRTVTDLDGCVDDLARLFFELRYPGERWPEGAEMRAKDDLFREKARKFLRSWGLDDHLASR